LRKEVQKLAADYIHSGSKRKRLRVLVSALSLVVTLTTLYTLSIPAMTLETDALPAVGEQLSGSNAAGDDASPPGSSSDAGQTESDTSGDTNSGADPGTAETPDDAEIVAPPPSDGTPADAGAPQEDTDAKDPDSTSEGDADAKDPDNTSEGDADDSEAPETVCERTVYAYTEDGLTVTAVLSDPAAVPDEAELLVTRITEEAAPERYAQLALLLQTGENPEPYSFSAYDICFVLEGAEVEPSGGTVSVTIQDATELAAPAAAEDIQVFHVLNEEGGTPALEELTPQVSAEPKEISFTTESLSAILLKKTTVVSPTKWIDSPDDLFTNTAYYNAGNPLGIAGSFHIVAFNTATLNSHTNGNVLAANFYANRNFGTDGLQNELTYAQNYATVSSSSVPSADHVIAIGSGNTLSQMPDGRYIINGVTVDRPKNIWKDANTSTLPFINLSEVHSYVSSLSASLSGLPNSNISTTLGGNNVGTNYIALTEPDGVGVYNITAAALDAMSDNNQPWFGIKGFSSSGGTVIINVNCSGYGGGTIDMPHSTSFINGSWLASGGVTSFTHSRVLWNFGNYAGTINTRELYGVAILAPNATVVVGATMNGTIIANNVTVDQESHRDDFVGKLPVSVTVNKVWKDSAGNTICGPALNGMSVTIQLYRLESGVKTLVGAPVTLNSSTGWSYTWMGLAKGYTYSVEELSITKNGSDVSAYYGVTYSSDGLSCGTICVCNQFQYSLPSTGGKGTAPVTTAGLFLIGVAFYINTKLKRPGKKGGASYST